MGIERVADDTLRGLLTLEEEKAFRESSVLFVGAILSVLGDKFIDAYLHIRDAKELSDALDAKFGAANAGGELYAMEQFNDYKMVDNRSVAEQAHVIQIMAKDSNSSSVCFRTSLSLSFPIRGEALPLP